MVEEVLREVLAGNEIRVYLTLLKLGTATAGEITKKSGVNRTNVYDALDKLLSKGLVSFVIKSNIKYFTAGDPTKILEMLKEKEMKIKTSKKKINRILPELLRIYKITEIEQEVNLYTGKEGIKSLLEDVIKTKNDIFVFGAEGKFKDLFGYYFKNWQKRRRKENLKINIIYNESVRDKRTKKDMPLSNMKYIPKEYESPATTFIYDNKVMIIMWSGLPFAILIKSYEISRSYRNFFNLLWKIAKD